MGGNITQSFVGYSLKMIRSSSNTDVFSSLSNLKPLKCAVGKKKRKKKRNTPNYCTNNRSEMKLVPVIMDYCPLQFDALIFFLGVHVHGGNITLPPNFNFFNVNP